MEKILEVLLANPGRYVSGEALAKSAGLTRAAIWKQIEQLRALGYIIDSAPRKGYLLTGPADTLLPTEVQRGLDTTRFGRTVLYQNEVDSTNAWGRRLAENGAAEGTVVVAETQAAGRGRMGRSWNSLPGKGLWFSLILRPALSAAELSGIMTVSAVCMAKAINQVAATQPQIKWPNDLLLQGRKVTGILAELKGELDLVNYVILGIGVNVNHTLADFPAELRDKAGSLAATVNRPVSRAALLRRFLSEFETVYLQLHAGTGLADVIAYAREHSATVGQPVTVSQGYGRTISGTALDLDNDGSLLLRRANGDLVRLNSGELIANSEPS